jgi:hypothetical protein
MFGKKEEITLRGSASNVRTRGATAVRGAAGSGQVSSRSVEVLTFSLTSPEGSAPRTIELQGKKPYFREVPVEDQNEVEVVGIPKPRDNCVRALKLTNLTTGVVTEGRRIRAV